MKKIFLGLLLVLLISACDNKPTEPKTEKQTIKIGVIAPLTGNNSIIGRQVKEGIEFAKKSLDHPVNYELIYEDDQLTPTKTIHAANKLINIDKVDAIITSTSVESSIIAPLAEKAGIMQIAVSSDTSFTKYKKNYALAPSPEQEVRFLLNELAQRGFKKVALFSAEEVYCNLVEKNIKKLIKEFNLELVYSEKFTVPTRDFRIMISKAKAESPDIFILQTWMPEIDILTKQIREKDKNIPITSLYGFFLSDTPSLYEGQFAVNVGTTDKNFSKRFYNEYGKYPEQMSALSYLMMELTLDYFANINNKIEDIFTKKDSVVGELKFDHNAIRFDPIIQEFRNGKPVDIEK